MSTLLVRFNSPTPAPNQYKIRYKRTTDPSYTEIIVPSTIPPPVVEHLTITGVTSGVNYNVEVQSHCGGNVYSSGFNVISNPMNCATYTITNTTSFSQPIWYISCLSIDTVNYDLDPFETIIICANMINPPYSGIPQVTITAGTPCIY